MLTDAAIAALNASDRSFLFFPPVAGLEANRWRFERATRIEFCAVNTESGGEIWFPRSSVAYITVEEGAITLALRRELQYQQGAVWPVRRGADEPPLAEQDESAAPEMPAAAGESPPARLVAAAGPRAPAGARRRARSWTSEPAALVIGTALAAAMAVVLSLAFARVWLIPTQPASVTISDAGLFSLVREDNRDDVMRKIGTPAAERELTAGGGDLEYRALLYPERNYAVVLMGVRQAGREPDLRFIGAVRVSDGAVISGVHLARDSSTDALLRVLGRQLSAGRQ